VSGFCCWKFKQIAKKLGFGRENQLEMPSNVFTLPTLEIFNSENVKKLKNVFTLVAIKEKRVGNLGV
jgi:hypothetical protein